MAQSVDNPSPRVPSEEFVQLFTRTQRPLYLFILAQVGNVHRAEEILQETNLVIWAKLDQFVPNTSFVSWARQIATYEILKHRQRHRREKLTFSDAFLAAVADEVVQLAGEQERRREALEHCLEKLPASDRELIQQRYQPGNSGKELAAHVGRPANSVYQSLGRIRRMLLECIQRRMATEASA
ncbi:sigma-70 family RNA polymerase sigma factor [Planctomicrobium piriforme]|uniref:RNA polymerase sigma-70 factor, ECF subfamily n=1 Tax=Planctomicrobium piriforme TaxID=1576369 RepID=A0A1I3AZ86_9PLAN|nr:sigma-70 family RNA polymerase sigma factor [Planctomicrobium piriforme]SFH55387.1 RNA polymerase sigma-70 factor, ECF subfamily [Planctomicrobium piriforme]